MSNTNNWKINPYTPLAISNNELDDGNVAIAGSSCRSHDNQSDMRHLFLKDTKKTEVAAKPVENELNGLFAGLNLDEKAIKEGPIVLYYGWFFPEDVCYALKEISEAYLRNCFFSVPQFERFLRALCEKAGVKDELLYYRYPAKNRKARELPDYHVTAKFCGREPQICSEYWPKVSHLIGSLSSIHIIGLFFTEKTYGFRVKLTEDQQAIFDERGVSPGSPLAANSSCDNNSILETKGTLLECSETSKEVPIEATKFANNNGKSNKNNHSKKVKPVPSEYHPKILVLPQEKNFAPCNSRAHITIGTAPLVHAAQTGEDLKDLVNLESRTASSVFYTDYTLDNGDTLRQFGRYGDAFMLYLSKAFIVKGEFRFKE